MVRVTKHRGTASSSGEQDGFGKWISNLRYGTSTSASHSMAAFLLKASNLVNGVGTFALTFQITLNYWILVYAVLIVPGYLLDKVSGPTLYILVPIPNYLMPVYAGHGGVELSVYFLLIAVLLFGSIACMIREDGIAFVRKLRIFIVRGSVPRAGDTNSFILVYQMFMALIFLNVLVVMLHTLFSQSAPTVPDSLRSAPLEDKLLGLANASVYEEFAARVLMLGLPLFLVARLSGKTDRPWYRYVTGGNMRMTFGVFFFSLTSSLLFGLAHMPAWGLWKVFPTLISGMAFSYIFLRKGVFSAIVLHFLVDYLSMPLEALENASLSPTFLSVITAILGILWVHLGIWYLVHFTVELGTSVLYRIQRSVGSSKRRPRVGLGTRVMISLGVLLGFWFIGLFLLNRVSSNGFMELCVGAARSWPVILVN